MQRGQANKQLILDFVTTFIASHHYAPTIREICEGTGIRSSSTVHLHLETLEDEGVLKRNGVKPRGLEVVAKQNEGNYPINRCSHQIEYATRKQEETSMVTKTKAGTKSKAKAEPKSQVVEEKKCPLLHKLIRSFTACISDDSFQRCNYCDYNRTDGCAGNSRRDAAALLKCVSVESIKFRCIPLTYIDGDNEITVYRPHFGFRIKSERHYWKRYKNSNSFMLDTTEGIIYRENLIQGIECCFPEDESTHRPKCQNCPYHALGCDEILELQILAFLMSITDSDVDEEALDAIMNPELPIDPETGMIIGSTEYLNYLDAIFQIDD